MGLAFYNTLTRRVESFRWPRSKAVGLYTCGPTVYWFAHIGNFRTFIFYDVVRRTLTHFGYRVRHVMNVTDVGHLAADSDFGEEKMAVAARAERKTAWEVAEHYTAAFRRDAALLNIVLPTRLPRATGHINEQIRLVRTLERKGYTYRTTDGIYFDTAKWKTYGKLSQQALTDKQGGKRVQIGEKKRANDFALWKFSPPSGKRDMEWPSPWGIGFPGWHVECSAMSRRYLGQPFAIHAGGIDHLGVHHENEIAQSEAAYGKPLARYWLHGEFLIVGRDAARMGKSLGNIATVDELTFRYGVEPLAFRYLCLTVHYRQKLSFSPAALQGAESALHRLRRALEEIPGRATRGDAALARQITTAMTDDFDFPGALAAVWEALRSKRSDRARMKRTILEFDAVFGLSLRPSRTTRQPERIRLLVSEREEARRTRNWALADTLRQRILGLGFVVEDTPQGPRVTPA